MRFFRSQVFYQRLADEGVIYGFHPFLDRKQPTSQVKAAKLHSFLSDCNRKSTIQENDIGDKYLDSDITKLPCSHDIFPAAITHYLL